MARKGCRAKATAEQTLISQRRHCVVCGQPMWVAYHTHRSITTLHGIYRLTLHVRRCRNRQCERYHCPYRPEEEGGWALPHGEFGLDVIALVGSLRYTAHRSIPEIHQALRDRGVPIAERTVTHLLQRYEELVALHLTDPARLRQQLNEQGQVILAIDGLQPDMGHEVLWVVRDCLSGEVILARSLLSACEADLINLLREVQQAIEVPIRGVISDGQRSIRKAIQTILPDVPHQLCHFHYLREAAKPVYEADRRAKVEKLASGREHDRLVLTPLDKVEEPESLLLLRHRVNRRLPLINLPELLLELHVRTGFLSDFVHISEHKSSTLYIVHQ
jgi:hypothetical protein